jgi:putative drug exporter of the RND superfamily
MSNSTSTNPRPTGGDGPQDAVQAFFARLGALVVRFRYLIVVLWVVLAVAATVGLPSITSVSNNNNASFLPQNEPSVKATRLAAPFQRGFLPTSTLVVARNGSRLTAADNIAVSRAEQAVRHDRGVVAVQDQGISQDGEARKAQVTLAADAFDSSATTYVDGIRATVAQAGGRAGLSFYLTGEVATQVDNAQASNNTLALTEILSVVVILVLLVLVYRALLAPFLTFLPSALVLVLAMPVIAEAHNLIGVQVSPITSLLLVVLVLGAGTDYGLFLAFRVREEMRRGLEPHAAVIRSLSRVGETITFSAGTVIAALVCLLLASLGFYQGLGPAMAIGIAIMLLAGLTLNPALLAIFGRRAFWPTTVRPGIYPISLWGRIAGRIVQRPLPVLLAGSCSSAVWRSPVSSSTHPTGSGKTGPPARRASLHREQRCSTPTSPPPRPTRPTSCCGTLSRYGSSPPLWCRPRRTCRAIVSSRRLAVRWTPTAPRSRPRSCSVCTRRWVQQSLCL